jgi:uncharacterized protein
MNPTSSPSSIRRYVFHELPIPPGFPESDLADALGRYLRIKTLHFGNIRIVRKSLDSRKRNHPEWKYSVEFDYPGNLKHPKVKPVTESEAFHVGQTDGPVRLAGRRVAIIGAGPAGLAAALGLSQKGYAVTVFEQGRDVKRRFLDIRRFIKQNKFDPKSNILFGEGGAGCFSDGKLTTRTRTPFTAAFLQALVESGADSSITYLAHPHIGTDRLQAIIATLRERCIALGASFCFDHEVQKLWLENGTCRGVIVDGASLPFDGVVFAAGLSAHPLYEALRDQGIALERKGFAVGMRVEHPQSLIDQRQLGDKVDAKQIGAAEYFLTYQNVDRDMAAYSFCMCPGGVVVPCADSEGALFTNGMSYSNRASSFANSAVVVPVVDADLPDHDVLAGIHFQRELERKAFVLGGGGYTFPVQTMAAFLDNQIDHGPFPKTSFLRPMVWSNLRDLFPARLNEALKQAFLDFDRKIPGFIRTGFLIGPESRTSAPIRLPRTSETLESVNTPGLFPIGEGAGYSGGITSSGGDGIRLASVFARVLP